jgi:hypothetical protein
VAKASDPASALLAKQTPVARELIEEVRSVVREVIPEVTEAVNMGWEVLLFSAGAGMRGMVAAVLPRAAYVNLQFADGADLPDPGKRLEGTGKRMRHVKIRTKEAAHHRQVKALLRAAAKRKGL